MAKSARPGLLARIRERERRRLFESPALLLAVLLAAAFVAEVVIMFVLSRIPHPSRLLESILDATLLSAILYPCLFSLIYRPLVLHITERRRVEEELHSSQERLRSYSNALQVLREDERTRISREIHDELGQSLTALKLDLAWLARRLGEAAGPLRDKAASLTRDVDDIIGAVKKISAELRPGILDDLGLGAAVEWQAREFERRTGIRCRVAVEPEDLSPDRDRATSLFRILQEALTNVARHAEATEVEVRLEEGHGELVLEVRDDGKGISGDGIADPASLGLLGIRERALAWGGSAEIAGTPGKGTRVRVALPPAAAGAGA